MNNSLPSLLRRLIYNFAEQMQSLALYEDSVCGFAAAHCGKPMAYRSGPFTLFFILRLSLRMRDKNLLGRKGEAFPHCAVAEPRNLIEISFTTWKLPLSRVFRQDQSE